MTTYKAYRRSTNPGLKTLTPVTEAIPPLKPTEVLLRIHAVSLNYRDVAMMDGKYPMEVIPDGIPASDCAAEVVEIGPEVKQFKIGDHVAPIFDLKNLTNTEDEMRALGGEVDGVLREYAVFSQDVLLHLPEHLSWEEV
jgi:NADPH:quinone reductase-like Zn-dependent oxidoreductase